MPTTVQAVLAINRLGPCADARATTTAARSAECFYPMRVVNRRSLYIKFLQTTSCDTLTSTCENSPPLMPVQRSHPGPKSCPAATVEPHYAGQTDGKRAGRFARQAKPPTHLGANRCRSRIIVSVENHNMFTKHKAKSGFFLLIEPKGLCASVTPSYILHNFNRRRHRGAGCWPRPGCSRQYRRY